MSPSLWWFVYQSIVPAIDVGLSEALCLSSPVIELVACPLGLPNRGISRRRHRKSMLRGVMVYVLRILRLTIIGKPAQIKPSINGFELSKSFLANRYSFGAVSHHVLPNKQHTSLDDVMEDCQSSSISRSLGETMREGRLSPKGYKFQSIHRLDQLVLLAFQLSHLQPLFCFTTQTSLDRALSLRNIDSRYVRSKLYSST